MYEYAGVCCHILPPELQQLPKVYLFNPDQKLGSGQHLWLTLWWKMFWDASGDMHSMVLGEAYTGRIVTFKHTAEFPREKQEEPFTGKGPIYGILLGRHWRGSWKHWGKPSALEPGTEKSTLCRSWDWKKSHPTIADI